MWLTCRSRGLADSRVTVSWPGPGECLWVVRHGDLGGEEGAEVGVGQGGGQLHQLAHHTTADTGLARHTYRSILLSAQSTIITYWTLNMQTLHLNITVIPSAQNSNLIFHRNWIYNCGLVLQYETFGWFKITCVLRVSVVATSRWPTAPEKEVLTWGTEYCNLS